MNISVSSNISQLKAKMQYVRDNLTPTMTQSLQEGGSKVVTSLSSAAPKGKSASSSTIPGDAGGPLSTSFTMKGIGGGDTPGICIETTQPTKLKFVRYGTGIYGPTGQRIVPKVKKALYWEGALHPVRSVSGEKPNDFVTPVITQGKQDIRDCVRKAVIDLIRTALS